MLYFSLRARRRRFAGAERGLRVSQGAPNIQYDRVRTPENAPRCRFQTLERRHGFAQIVGSGASGTVERLRVIHPHHDREFITISENAPRHGYRFAQQFLGFFEAL